MAKQQSGPASATRDFRPLPPNHALAKLYLGRFPHGFGEMNCVKELNTGLAQHWGRKWHFALFSFRRKRQETTAV